MSEIEKHNKRPFGIATSEIDKYSKRLIEIEMFEIADFVDNFCFENKESAKDSLREVELYS